MSGQLMKRNNRIPRKFKRIGLFTKEKYWSWKYENKWNTIQILMIILWEVLVRGTRVSMRLWFPKNLRNCDFDPKIILAPLTQCIQFFHFCCIFINKFFQKNVNFFQFCNSRGLLFDSNKVLFIAFLLSYISRKWTYL